MKKTRTIICVALAFVALLIVWGDYSDGHAGEDVFAPDFCPICWLYGSTEIPQPVRVTADWTKPFWFDIPVLYAPSLKRLSTVVLLFALRAPPVYA